MARVAIGREAAGAHVEVHRQRTPQRQQCLAGREKLGAAPRLGRGVGADVGEPLLALPDGRLQRAHRGGAAPEAVRA